MSDNWNTYWQKESNRSYWLEPDKAVVDLKQTLETAGVVDVLDLGCGVGRHALFLARCGFNVTALDSSIEALDVLKKLADEKGAKITTVHGDYSQDSFMEDSFDFVLAYNVLYHGDSTKFRDSLALIHRWLRPGGLLFFTCPTRRDDKYGNGELVSPHTYKPLNSIHPGDIHYFANEADISDFLHEFDEISRTIDEHYWDNNGIKQLSSYWQVLAKNSD